MAQSSKSKTKKTDPQDQQDQDCHSETSRSSSGSSSTTTISNRPKKRKARKPLVPSQDMQYKDFVHKAIRPHNRSRHWSEIKSCMKPRSKSSTTTNNTENAPSKSVRFCTNPKNNKVWCMIQFCKKIKEKYHDKLWWSEEDMFDRNADDEDMAALFEGHFVSILQLAYETSNQQATKHKDPSSSSSCSSYRHVTRKHINGVELDMQGMKACSEARGLESLVCTDIQRNVRKHRRAVLAAQDLLYEKGTPLDSSIAIDFIAAASAKYSHASRTFSKKMAQFDNDDSKYGFKSSSSSRRSKATATAV